MNNNDDAAERKSESGEQQSLEIWKQLPVTFRNRLRDLTGAQLKVWIAYFCHSDEGGKGWAGLKLLSEETGLSDDYISKARGELIQNGWLVPQGRLRSKSAGTFSGAEKYLVAIPTATTRKSTGVDKPQRHQRPKKSGTGQSRDTSTGKFQATSTGKSPVRSRSLEVDTCEVEPSNPSVGWMVSLLVERTLEVPIHPAEHDALILGLEKKYGTEEVKRRFKAWLHRPLDGLKFPLLKFYQEWDVAGQLLDVMPEQLL